MNIRVVNVHIFHGLPQKTTSHCKLCFLQSYLEECWNWEREKNRGSGRESGKREGERDSENGGKRERKKREIESAKGREGREEKDIEGEKREIERWRGK